MPNQLINMEVLRDLVMEKMGDNVKFLPLTKVVPINEQAGTIVVPKQHYIGDAQAVAAGQPIPIDDFDQVMVNLPIGKIAKALSFTEEDLLSMAGEPAELIRNQITASVNKGLDKAIVAKLSAITGAMVHDASVAGKVDAAVVADALQKFGEDQEDSYLFVNPATLTAMRKEEGFVTKSAERGINIVGEIYGANVVNSAAVPAGEAYVVKEGALALYLRKAPLVETDKNIVDQKHYFTGTVFFGAHLEDESRAVKIKLA